MCLHASIHRPRRRVATYGYLWLPMATYGYGLTTYGYRTRLVGEASRAALLGREYCDGRVGGGGVRGRDGARALDAVVGCRM